MKIIEFIREYCGVILACLIVVAGCWFLAYEANCFHTGLPPGFKMEVNENGVYAAVDSDGYRLVYESSKFRWEVQRRAWGWYEWMQYENKMRNQKGWREIP